MVDKIRLLLSALMLCGMFTSLEVYAAIYTHTVDGRENMYNTYWTGNPFLSAVGTGVDARSVTDSDGNPVNFSNLRLTITATGLVEDFSTTSTDADGLDSIFRGLPVYSMIGLWSSTGDSITALGESFFIGTNNVLDAPSSGTSFLFLAENDGIFSDNYGQYNVTISTVPLPASAVLFLTGILSLFSIAKINRRG